MTLVVDPVAGEGGRYVPQRGPVEFANAGYCGHSFNGGIIRFHDSVTGPMLRQSCFDGFPELADLDRKADVLAFDWRGRQYLTAQIKGQHELFVIRADIAAGTLDPLAPVTSLPGILRAPNMGDYFEAGVFQEWKVAVGAADSALKFTDCVDFEVPLFLGGEPGLSNLKLIDLDVAWTIGAQVRRQVLGLPIGN